MLPSIHGAALRTHPGECWPGISTALMALAGVAGPLVAALEWPTFVTVPGVPRALCPRAAPAHRCGGPAALVLGCLLGVMAWAPAAAAGQDPGTACSSSGPSSSCRGFLIFDLTAHALVGPGGGPPLPGGTAPSTGRDRVLGGVTGWTLGYAMNGSGAWAFGAAASLEFGWYGARRRAITARVLRPAGASLALEVAPGLVFLDAQDHVGSRTFTGLTLGLRIVAVKAFSASVRWDGVHVPPGAGFGQPPAGFEQGVSVGVGLHSTAGLVGSVVFIGGVLLSAVFPAT